MIKRLFVGAVLCLSLGVPVANAYEQPDMDAFLRSKEGQVANIAQALWNFAEVGYQEEKSASLLVETLREEGFQIETGLADIPTAFVGSYKQGDGGPVIGILAEFDALPGINQDASPRRSPVPGKGSGQACGHNLFGAGSMGAAIAVKYWLETTGTPGEIRLYGTPAEEGGSGKVYMTRAGLFDDADIVLHWHPGDSNMASARTTLANRSAKFRFRGVSAHAAGAPHKARSALDGVEAFNYMTNLMREHVPQETRIHYVITDGGKAPNVVPDFAEVFYYVRHPDAKTLVKIWDRVEAAAKAAAMGTGTQMTSEIIHGNHPVLINETLQKHLHKKMSEIGGITYTKSENVFARELYTSLVEPNYELGSEGEIQPYEVKLGYGSTDVGDVSMSVPTGGIRTATFVPGTPSHSWQAVAAGGMSIGHKGANLAAKVLALSAIDLYTDEALRKAAKAEFDERRGEDFHYEALLGDRDPPLDYRK